MLIPIYARVPRRRVSWCTWALVLLILGAFLQTRGALSESVSEWGLIPDRLMAAGADVKTYGTLLSHTMLHAGWLHVGMNLLFLVVFGTAVEQKTGSPGFFVIYVVSAIIGAGAHCWLSADRSAACIGASGAVSAILGLYLVLYTRGRVVSLILTFVVETPGWLFAVLWLWLQLKGVQQYISGAANAENVGWFAHLGGFACGVLLGLAVRLLVRRSSAGPRPTISTDTKPQASEGE